MPYNQNQLWGMNCSRESAVSMTHVRSCVPPRAHLFLWDVSPLGLKQFAETNHVAELANRALCVLCCLVFCSWKKSFNERKLCWCLRAQHNSEHAKIVAPISMATSILLKSRCPKMNAQAYRLQRFYGIVEKRKRSVNQH